MDNPKKKINIWVCIDINKRLNKWINEYGRRDKIFLQKNSKEYRATIWSWNPTPGHIPKKTIIQRDTCTPMFIAALCTIAKNMEAT